VAGTFLKPEEIMLEADPRQFIRPLSREFIAWLASPPVRRVLLVLLLLVAGEIGFAAYEAAWLHLPLVREEPPHFAAYQLFQTVFAVAISAALVSALVAARAHAAPFDAAASRRRDLAVGLVSVAAAMAATILFLVDPRGFHDFAQEDRPLEWASALLLLLAAGVIAVHASSGRRDRFSLAIAALLCVGLFVLGMEEISWGQRLFGFATPERLAEVNWQSEFNFHNVQTDLSETVYYFGAGIFLVLLPLLRDVLRGSWLALPPFAFLPQRSVALVSAPILIFNYGHWDLLPVQLSIVLGFFVLLACARGAAMRGNRGEAAVWATTAAIVLAGQLLFLGLGARMTEVPDATEYKEFFIALP
jgi:hypothetical protein